MRERLTLTIEKAVAGGRMLARHDGAIVLVAGAIPGETVEAEVEKTQRGTMWATTTRVLQASPDRQEPFCDLACGGSVYAHVRYERQLDLKREVIRDAFARLARLPLGEDIRVVPSRTDGYRMRARLHVVGDRIGFFREGTHELCDAASTRQLLAETNDTIARLAAALTRAPRAKVRELEISENCAGDQRAVHLELDADGDPSQLGSATQVEGLVGASCGAPHHARALTLWGTPSVTDTVAGVTLTRQARAFFQGNRYLLNDLVTHVAAQARPAVVLDLYAGVGLFSAVLAARGSGEVIAVEGDRTGAEDLKRNLAPFANAEARHQSVETFLTSRASRRRLDTILVDPPRTGMTKDALRGAIALKAPRIVYVSCDIATLARDTRILLDAGYYLDNLTAFDMFPNTAHVESVAVFQTQ